MKEMIVTIRKILRTAVLAGMILFTGCRQTAEASGQLPLDIRARFGGIEITDTAYWDSPESTWFVLIRTPDRTNILLCFVLENGTWTQKFQTDTAVPQGEDRVSILFTDQVKESTDGRTETKPILTILQYGTGDDASVPQRQYEFLRTSPGVWELIRAQFTEAQLRLEISEDAVIFLLPTGEEIRTDIPAGLDRDLRRTDLAGIPATPEEAEAPPAVPAD